jgi:serine/threonine protein kinase/tetratricopeptide (TPR) repeat protein
VSASDHEERPLTPSPSSSHALDAAPGDETHDAPTTHDMAEQWDADGPPPQAADLASGPRVPAQIGPYRLTALLGEGGMGQVFLAEQDAPLRRQVALKLIKRGMDTDAILRRFATERKALALMNHPAIARVLDAGATDDGRPYVVMEAVQGARLSDYCDRRALDVPARLRLFLDVLRGVQHAHQKGILHRDLKPSNILVTEIDGRPQPKIIDFGIAKAITDDEPLATHLTVVGQFVGTPEYMSPEQAGALSSGVDTRSDVYSLGVILYELLTGRRPYALDRRTPTAVSAHMVERRVPRRPSAIVQPRTQTRRPDVTAADHAAARRSSPARLRRALRGDLDTIVLEAMQQDPARRYGSVEQFAGDIERYLAGQPVLARPDTWTYRADRFVRRHAYGVAVSALAVLALAIFVGMLVRERTRARGAEQEARNQAEAATQVSEFLVGLFDIASPDGGSDPDVTARDLVDRGAERIRQEMTGAPVVRGQLLDTLGKVYLELGRAEQAEPLLRDALAVRRAHFGPRHAAVAETLGRLARVRLLRHDREESRRLYEEALAIYEATDGPTSARYAEVLNNLSGVHMEAGRFREAAAMLDRSLALRKAEAGGTAAYGSVLYNLAVAHYELAEYQQAAAVLDEATPLLRAQYGASGRPHTRLVAVASFRGLVLRESKRLVEARQILEAGVADARQVYRDPHPALATILNNLALVVQDLGDLDQAERLFREVLDIDRAVYGERHADVAHDYFNLGTFLYRHRGRRAEGSRMVERALEMRRAVLGDTHPATALAMRTLAQYRVEAGRVREGLRMLEAAHGVQASTLPPTHPGLIETRRLLDAARARLR